MIATVAIFSVMFTTLVFAAYIHDAGKVVNEFNAAVSTNPTVTEKFDDYVKEDVQFNVGNTNDYPVYVRAKYVVTWQKKNPEYDAETNPNVAEYLTYFKLPLTNQKDPKDDDYEIKLNFDVGENGGKWKAGDDGYYYYIDSNNALKSVVSGGLTDVFIKECKQLKDPPEGAEGYTLSVDIIVQTVQAVGYTDVPGATDPRETGVEAWKDAWNLSDPGVTNAPAPTDPVEPEPDPAP